MKSEICESESSFLSLIFHRLWLLCWPTAQAAGSISLNTGEQSAFYLLFSLFFFSSQRAWCKVFKEMCHTETQASDQANGTAHVGVIKQNQMVCLKANVLWRSVLCGALSSSYTAADENLCSDLVLLRDLQAAHHPVRFQSDGFQNGRTALLWKLVWNSCFKLSWKYRNR